MASSNPSLLLGPPEIHANRHQGGGGSTSASASQFGFTENNSLTYVATGNPCLDFFFKVVPSTESRKLVELLKKAYTHNPLTALKLIFNLRGVRGTGKSDKEGFYTAALWLHNNHPRTLACNTKVVAEFGYYKDLLEILFRLLEGENVRERGREEWRREKAGKDREAQRRRSPASRRQPIVQRSHHKRKASTLSVSKEKESSRGGKPLPRDVRLAEKKAKFDAGREEARELRLKNVQDKAKRAFDRYSRDPVFRFLHDCVADVFAEDLIKDVQSLNAGEITKISLASKWCPSLDSSYDKATLICESIARRVFPKESYPEYEGIEEAHYVYRIRDRLRKQVLVPLHKVLEIPEVYMCANKWESIPYNRVPSVAMKNYKPLFLDHDPERFNGYLEDVKKGDDKIAAGALLPHEIIARLHDRDDQGKVAEVQWARMVEDMLKNGKLNNCIAVCDVSGSMKGTPMEVCVALGLLISELSQEPWKGKVITFSERPQIHLIKGDSLLEKTRFVREMDWGTNTDFQKVFDRILQVAVDGNLSEEQMIKKVIVFSDMEFDEASGHHRSYNRYSSDSDTDGSYSDSDTDDSYTYRRRRKTNKRPKGWETDYEVIQRKFREKGFKKVPDIVFWNLRDSEATPVHAEQTGVAMVSGFSKNMVKLFLDNVEIANPVEVMEQAISGELYQKLVVWD
ncbi:hypothetical protein Tsubulata_001190 [Turnera subulata]|uniref:Uncharacterized protein n=1 Tax=Turnera subulata TaxID=218843 RepID=A0A9Q0F8B3_9ROSI|nr:hypothetical protein Tsubulata_001190 [Turnera subulata]